jgi:uncharacterized protein (TIGR02145 family)
MKATCKFGMWKAIAFLTVGFLFSCTSCDDPIDPPVSKAVAIIQPAINVTINSATVVAKVLPNEDGARAAFEMRESGQSNWVTYPLILTYSIKDTLKVTFDFPDLKANTKYDFRIKVANKAGESVSETANFETYAVTDFDGNYYHTVTIGTQTWLRENFKGTHFANGDIIPNITDQTQWEAAKNPAYCYYNNDIKNAETYGALYNWYVASDSRELIAGFHTPSEAEFRTIANYLGGQSVAGGAMKEAGFTHWIEPNAGATNSSGFTGLPAGVRQSKFSNMKDGVDFWTKDIFMGMSNLGYCFSLGQTNFQLRSAGDYLWVGSVIRVIRN